MTAFRLYTLAALPGEFPRRTPRCLAAAASVLVSCALPIVLAVGVLPLSAQMSSKRYVDVTVTDPHGRLVTGLEQERFEIIENGIRRAITDFSDAGSPLSLAIVGEEPLSAAGALGRDDELIQTPSLSDALRQLAASKNSRKTIVITSAADLKAIPSSIQTVQTDPANLLKAVIQIRNQYRLEFMSFKPAANVEVVLNQPLDLPRLKLNWK